MFGMRPPSAPTAAPSASQIQNVQSRQQSDAVKALDVMKDMRDGKISPQEGMKKLGELWMDAAKAQMSLAPGAPPSAPAAAPPSAPAGAPPPSAPPGAPTTGFSTTDSFEGPTAKPAVDLLGLSSGGVSAGSAGG